MLAILVVLVVVVFFGGFLEACIFRIVRESWDWAEELKIPG